MARIAGHAYLSEHADISEESFPSVPLVVLTVPLVEPVLGTQEA